MHVMMKWEKCIETYDTAADGKAAMTKAALGTKVVPRDDVAYLILWSQLYESVDDADGRVEHGNAQTIATLNLAQAAQALGKDDGAEIFSILCERAETVSGFLEVLGQFGDALDYRHRGKLLACEVDGAPLWEAETEG